MPLNKRHHIVDDAVEQIGSDVEHSTRIGLARNTVEQSIPVIITDLSKLLLQELCMEGSFDPILLHIPGEVLVAVLLVKVEGGVKCIPYKCTEGKWLVYDMYFELRGEEVVLKAINPFMDKVDEISGPTMDHVNALAHICGGFITLLNTGRISLREKGEDFSKINAKRHKLDKCNIVNDWEIEWLDSDSD